MCNIQVIILGVIIGVGGTLLIRWLLNVRLRYLERLQEFKDFQRETRRLHKCTEDEIWNLKKRVIFIEDWQRSSTGANDA